MMRDLLLRTAREGKSYALGKIMEKLISEVDHWRKAYAGLGEAIDILHSYKGRYDDRS